MHEENELYNQNQTDYREALGGKQPNDASSDAAKRGWHDRQINQQIASNIFAWPEPSQPNDSSNAPSSYTFSSYDYSGSSGGIDWGDIGELLQTKTAIGIGLVGVACVFSENARWAVGKTAGLAIDVLEVVIPPTLTGISYAFRAAAYGIGMAATGIYYAGYGVATGIYYAGYYGYETVATAINNVDLLVVGGGTFAAANAVSAIMNRDGKLYDKGRNLIAACVVAAAATATAVYLTGTQARKLGYEIGLPQLTETGTAISAWGRARTITAPQSLLAPSSPATHATQVAPVIQTPPVRQTVTAPVTAAPLPPHRTEQELNALVRSLRGGQQLSPEQIRQLSNKGVTIRGTGQNTTIVVAPGHLPPSPLPPQNTESAHQRWEQLNKLQR